ncbi:MAG: FapA family protein [Synergistota bacterium]|nr:FapA family protein [Synergistota bacterium]
MANEKYMLEIHEDGLYLRAREDADYSLSSVVGFLKSHGVQKYDSAAVEVYAKERSLEPRRIADRDPSVENQAEMEVKVSPDGLTAELWVEPPFADLPWPTEEQALLFLREKGIVEGVDSSIVASLISERSGKIWIPVAYGVAPSDGVDAEVEYKVEFGSGRPKEEVDGGKVDLRNLSNVTIILKDQLLAVKHPPTEGNPGVTVRGEPLKGKPGKDRPLPAGAGTYVSEDGLSLHAMIDGNLVMKGNKLNVIPVFQVDGDVDFSIGNINFIGAVVVNGAVREGFEINTSGNIEIRGVVEGAHLSSKGDIMITGGVRGMNKALLQADGDISAGFVDQAKLRSGKDINVNNAVLHSDLGANGKITVLGGTKAQIAGGKIQAGHEVTCLTLGSEMGTRTEVAVGVLPELAERKKVVLASLAENEEKAAKIEANLAFLKKAEESEQLDENKRALMISLTKAKFQTQSQLIAAADELKEIDAQMESSKARGCVRVKGTCHPGVTVTVRGVTYVVREKQTFCSFIYHEGEVVIRPFDH